MIDSAAALTHPPITAAGPSNQSRAKWVLVAIFPYALVYLSHFLLVSDGTGFIHSDQPYYTANGREVFERGNGFAYPNPYDPDPAAPVIYFHWLPWLLGAGVKLLGFDPGYQYAALGAIAAVAFAWLTLLLVEAALPEARYRNVLFLVAMWGGGLACAAGNIHKITHGAAGAPPFAFDPGEGWWFLNWGRNVLFPTEALYHALAAASWLAILRRRWAIAAIATVLLAATHPFSGVQLLAINGTWLTILLALNRPRGVVICWISLAIAGAVFLWYYGVFLNSFPQHCALSDTWQVPWYLRWPDALLGFGPVGALAAWRLIRQRSVGRDEAFWLVVFAVSLLLAKHELFLPRTMQPIHFARGYIWIGLFMLALPMLQRWLIAANRSPARRTWLALAAVVGLIATWDNAAFIRWHLFGSPYAYRLSPAEREMFGWMDRKRLDGVLLCPDPSLSYLSATYTGVRPYRGHFTNTPQSLLRWEQIERWVNEPNDNIEWLNPIDYVLAGADAPRHFMQAQGYDLLHENEELILFGRRRL